MKKNNKKIFIVLPWNTDGPAGIENSNILLIKEFEKYYDIYVTPILRVQPKNNQIEKNFSKKIKLYPIIAPRLRNSVFQLARQIRQINPDLILCNAFHVCAAAILAKKMFLSKCKVVSINHGIGPLNSKERIYTLFINLFSKKIVTVSRGIKDDLVRRFKMNPHKIEVIYNPFDIDNIIEKSFKPIKEQGAGWEAVKKLIVYVGRIDEHSKSISTILESLAWMASEKKTYINLLVIGDGEEKENTIALCRKLDIEKQVFFLGWKENPYPFIRISDALVLSSKYEGLPTVLVEALACGVPVVSTNCPHGPAEILDNGKYGKLVPTNDFKALSEAILETLDNPPDKKILINRSRYFSIEKSANKYIDIFKKLLF